MPLSSTWKDVCGAKGADKGALLLNEHTAEQ